MSSRSASYVPGPARRRAARWSVAALVGLSVVLAGCGGTAPGAATPAPGPGSPSAGTSAGPTTTSAGAAAEVNPSGDIPDNQAYVPYTSPDGLLSVSVPEGWSRSAQGGAVVFSDKLNAIRIETTPSPQPPTHASALAALPTLAGTLPGFAPGQVSTTNRDAGTAVLLTYQALSTPDPVTGKATPNAVERYEFWHAGQQVDLVLSGPVGADNVDPWRQITDSLKWQR